MSNATHRLNPQFQTYNLLEEIHAFDALPPAVRDAINYAKFTISSKLALSLWQAFRNEQQVITAIKQIEDAMEKGEING